MHKRGDSSYDKLYKIRPLINKLNINFYSNFNPSRNIAIDESMIAFKERTTLKQYMLQKPIKSGIKVWASAFSKTGHLLQFEIYQGKLGGPEVGLGERVVISLVKRFEKKIYCFLFRRIF